MLRFGKFYPETQTVESICIKEANINEFLIYNSIWNMELKSVDFLLSLGDLQDYYVANDINQIFRNVIEGTSKESKLLSEFKEDEILLLYDMGYKEWRVFGSNQNPIDADIFLHDSREMMELDKKYERGLNFIRTEGELKELKGYLNWKVEYSHPVYIDYHLGRETEDNSGNGVFTESNLTINDLPLVIIGNAEEVPEPYEDFSDTHYYFSIISKHVF